eukprot:2353524-Alexandrium_andersonii.AAC.1
MRPPRKPGPPGRPLAGQQRQRAPCPNTPGAGPSPGRPASAPPQVPKGGQPGRSTRPQGGHSSSCPHRGAAGPHRGVRGNLRRPRLSPP